MTDYQKVMDDLWWLMSPAGGIAEYKKRMCLDAAEAIKELLQQVEDMRKLESHSQALENKPLTLEELREMDGEPVWVEYPNFGLRLWAVLHGERLMRVVVDGRMVREPGVHFTDGRTFSKRGYGITWHAYRRKPEEVALDDS